MHVNMFVSRLTSTDNNREIKNDILICANNIHMII